MSKARTFWIARDKELGVYWGKVCIFTSKPKYRNGVFYHPPFVDACHKHFARVTGIKLNLGECRKVKITVTLEDEPCKRKTKKSSSSTKTKSGS